MQTDVEVLRYGQVRFRHELKYAANEAEARMVATRMAALLQRDRHAGRSGSYTITSLYFDTPYDEALRQKIEGFTKREKFRIRYYGTGPQFCKLEKKLKSNGLCSKRSVRITPCEARRVLAGDIGFLLEGSDPLMVEFYSKLRGQLLKPCVVVRYERQAFTCPMGNTRVTVDENVRSSLSVSRFFDADTRGFDPMNGLAVVEVKYDSYLPAHVGNVVAALGRSAQACSKYALGRRFG